MKKLFLFLATVLIFLTLFFANCTRHMGGWGDMMCFGYGGALMWIIFLILIGVVVYFIVQSTKSKTPESSSRETPMDILKKRYASGEITKEEFDQAKRDLEG